MSLRSLLVRQLRSARGSYTPNHFLLLLDKDTPFFATDATGAFHIDMDYFHIHVHEYWHYWQNVSTVSGFKSFAFAQHLLPSFSRTLLRNANGTSEGSASLDADTVSNVDTLLQLRHDLEGDEAPDSTLARDWQVDFRVVGFDETPASLVYFKADAPNPLITLDVECRWPDGRSERKQMELGSLAIEESVAFLIEEQIRKIRPNLPFDRPPAFPYRMLERVLEYIVGEPPDPFTVVSLGTMALLTTHAGAGLVTLAQRYRDALRAGRAPMAALSQIEAIHRSSALPIFDLILGSDLRELEDMHEGRGYVESATAHYGATLRRALDRRRTDSLFDIRRLFPTATESAVIALQRDFPTCDTLQERPEIPGTFPRDLLVSVDPTPADGHGETPSTYMRSLQAQQDFLFAHVDAISRSYVPSEQAESRCPYFGACHLPLRKAQPDICETAPWNAYDHTGGSCWYATGVAATMAKVQFKRKLENK